MYKEILKTLDSVIEHHKKKSKISQSMTERDDHYFIQGLGVAKQQVEQLEDFHTDELAYETLEVVVRTLKGKLDKSEMEEIIDDAWKENFK